MARDWYQLADQEVAAVCAALPPDLRACLTGLSITLAPRPEPDEQSEEDDEENLLGLFIGSPYAEAAEDPEPLPGSIRLFVENIREESGDDPESFRQEVRDTLLHEIGHFLGLDEDGLAARGL
ncbi:MAG TPA: metallopeptidase family protein [Kiritimatiellia bacterium]|nr:metallopeptidase family protein [Kiritimatiellia bacterium]HRU71484.1 metallopeptidase family protein [Kiritimatiellia bacterium]